MNIKRILALTLSMIMIFTTASFAAVPDGVVVIGDTAYELTALAKSELESTIQSKFVANGNKLLYKGFDGNWVDQLEDAVVSPVLPSTLTLVKGDGTTEVITVEQGEVVSVSAIEATIVEVTFEALADKVEGATVVVKDSEGVVREVVAQDLAAGATTAQFDFVKTVKTDDLKGVWTVDGKEYSFVELKLVEDIVAEAAEATVNQVKLYNLLVEAGVTDVDANNMVTHAADITTANGKSALVWTSDVQTVVDKTNEDAADATTDAAKVKPVLEATNQVQLLAALKANFDRVNADWIAKYSVGDATHAGIKIEPVKTDDNTIYTKNDGTAGTDVEDVQTAIDLINAEQIALANHNSTGADTAAKQAKVTALIQDWVKADDPKTPLVTPKADAIKASQAKEAAFRVAEATTANSLYNALVAYANATTDAVLKASDVKADLKADYKDVLDAGTAKADLITQIKTDHAAAGGVKAVLVTAVNESFGNFVVVDATVPAGATATPTFKIKALRKDGELFTVSNDATAVTVAIGTSGDLAYKATTSKKFTEAPLSEMEIEVDGTNFALPTIGAVVEPVIQITVDADGTGSVVHTVKGKLTVTAGANNDAKTVATMTLDKTDGKYVSGEDVTISFTLKNADDITLVSENGTYAATITLDTEKIYKDITFVNGKATVTVPARTATATAADVKVELTTKDNGAVSITKAASIEIKAAAFSELEIKADASKKVELTATDGVNPITDFGTKLVNIKVVQVTGTGENTVETPVEMTGTDYAGNISATFASGVYTNAKVLAAGTYKVTVTVAGVTTTKTIVVPA